MESIRTFDVESQLSIQRVPSVTIIPNIENKLAGEKRSIFLDVLPANTLIFTQDYEFFAPKWAKNVPEGRRKLLLPSLMG